MAEYYSVCPNCKNQQAACECPIRSLHPRFTMGPLNSDMLDLAGKVQQLIDELNALLIREQEK
jgi:hypothetical protein